VGDYLRLTIFKQGASIECELKREVAANIAKNLLLFGFVFFVVHISNGLSLFTVVSQRGGVPVLISASLDRAGSALLLIAIIDILNIIRNSLKA
jgi:hypothetical protein